MLQTKIIAAQGETRSVRSCQAQKVSTGSNLDNVGFQLSDMTESVENPAESCWISTPFIGFQSYPDRNLIIRLIDPGVECYFRYRKTFAWLIVQILS